MAKGKDDKKYTPAQLMALKASVRTDLASKSTVGPVSSTTRMVDQSKLADPYPNAPRSQRAYNALNTAGRFAAESVALGAAGKAAKTAYTSTYALGKKVVHGSPVRGLQSISPRSGSAAMPESKVNFSWNPSSFGRDKGRIATYAAEYTGEKGTGAYYVGKVRRGDIVKPPKGVGSSNSGAVVSKGPIKVTKEIPRVDGSLKDMDAISKAFPVSRAADAAIKRKNQVIKQLSKKDNALKNRNGKNSVV
jgi:hypothetical protein